MMKGPVPKTVSAYIARLPTSQRGMMRKIRTAVTSAAPEATELISYQMPALKQKRILLYYAAFTDHYSIFVPSLRSLTQMMPELKKFYVKGATIHFTDDHPIPISLVKKLVKWRVKEEGTRVRKR